MPRYQLPYHFISNEKTDSKILKKIVSHAVTPDTQEELYSGEIKVELTCLTPFFTGAERYVQENGQYRAKAKTGDEKEHTYIAPLTYPSLDVVNGETLKQTNRILIAPTTLKGVYANLIDMLTCAPMKRIREAKKGIHFRVMNPSHVKAGILNKTKEGEWQISPLEKYQFDEGAMVSTNRNRQERWKTATYQHPNFPKNLQYPNDYKYISILVDETQEKLIIAPELIKIYEKSWDRKREINYYFTDDSFDELVKNGVWESRVEILRSSPHLQDENNPIRIRKEFRDAVKKELKSNNGLPQEVRDQAILLDQILNVAEKTLVEVEEPPQLKSGMIIFYLLNDDDEVIAISPNLRMKWPFRDSIHSENRFAPDKTKRRKQIGYFEEEARKEEPKLSPRQRLFGYTLDTKLIDENAEEHYLSSYAGRVHFNFAQYVPGTGEVESEELTLKILGQPKPSAYEHYVKPNQGIGDYGLPTQSAESQSLAGRKQYLHYPPANSTESVKERSNQNSTLFGYLRPNPNKDWREAFPQFRFTVRFDKLEAYEVGMLLFILNLSQGTSLQDLHGIFEKAVQNRKNYHDLKRKEILALKLGYARPLGFGSILTQICDWNIRSAPQMDQENLRKANSNQEYFQKEFMTQMREWFSLESNTEIWKSVPHLEGLKSLLLFRVHDDYPNVEFNYPQKNGEIFKHHMEVHKEHLRRYFENEIEEEQVFPSPIKVWTRSIKG